MRADPSSHHDDVERFTAAINWLVVAGVQWKQWLSSVVLIIIELNAVIQQSTVRFSPETLVKLSTASHVCRIVRRAAKTTCSHCVTLVCLGIVSDVASVRFSSFGLVRRSSGRVDGPSHQPTLHVYE
jgi:hypothetical protein